MWNLGDQSVSVRVKSEMTDHVISNNNLHIGIDTVGIVETLNLIPWERTIFTQF